MRNRPFKITKGNSKIVFGVNYKKNRVLTINELIEENEEIVRSAGDSSLGDSELKWTIVFELTSK